MNILRTIHFVQTYIAFVPVLQLVSDPSLPTQHHRDFEHRVTRFPAMKLLTALALSAATQSALGAVVPLQQAPLKKPQPLTELPLSSSEKFLIELAPYQTQWVTEEEKWDLKLVGSSASLSECKSKLTLLVCSPGWSQLHRYHRGSQDRGVPEILPV